MKILKTIVPFFFLLVLFGCATGSAIVTGNTRPAIDPSEVKIYLNSPSQYEIIGLIEASSDVEISSQAAQDRVIAELKKQAAKIGANGVLLTDSGNKSSGAFYTYGYLYFSDAKTAKGQAIYVVLE